MNASPRRAPPPVLSVGPLALALFVPWASACSRAPAEELVVSDSAYVALMTELMLLRDSLVSIHLPYWSQQQVLDSVEIAFAEEHGVTTEDLFEFARVAGRDPERMQRLWQTIQARVDSIRPPEDRDAEESPRRRFPGSAQSGG